jgi:hypothetical protein
MQQSSPQRRAHLVRFHVLFAALVAALSGAAYSSASLPDAAERAAATILAEDLRAHVRLLASDELQGRGTGHPGNEIAALYLASVFERLRLTPAAGQSFLQPVELYFSTLGPDSELALRRSGTQRTPETRVRLGTDFQPHAMSASRTVAAPLVFAGYGITAPDRQYDDYAGVDVRDRIVIALDGEPPHAQPAGPERHSGYGRADHKIQNAGARGAAGLLLVRTRLGDPRASWPENPSVRSRQYQLASRVAAASLPVAWVSASAADALLGAAREGRPGASAGSNERTTATLRARIDQAVAGASGTAIAAPASFIVEGSEARLTIDLARQRTVMHNVLAMLEGEDPDLRQEIVVLGAHLDHDGVDAEGRIYNGGDDNASGTAAVVEAAEAFAIAAHEGRRPARTVVFALWNGEEKGLLGSRAYLETPVPAGRQIVAKVNLDMVGRDEDVPDPNDHRFIGLARTTAAENANVMHVLGYSYSPGLAEIIRRENGAIGLTIKETLDDSPTNLIRRSDHWPFLQQQIPAVFLTTGLHPDYHTPQDDTALINFAKLERIARLAFRVTWRVATDPSVPDYLEPATPSPTARQ